MSVFAINALSQNAQATNDTLIYRTTHQAPSNTATPNEPNEPSEPSLEKLTKLYQTSNDHQCQGTWLYPALTPTDQNLEPKPDTVQIIADRAYYDNDNHAELLGDVVIAQNGQQIQADKISYHFDNGQVAAQGNVLFSQTKDETKDEPQQPTSNATFVGLAKRLSYNFYTQAMDATDVAFADNQHHAHAYAERIHNQDHRYTLRQAMFSTCPPNKRHWQINAEQITLDYDTGRAIANNATLKIKQIPVLKLPYFNFPIDNQRASGFLLPTGGFNNQEGLRLSIPYYLNLAPNYDATITPTLFTNNNPMLSAQVRFLSKDYGEAHLDGAYLFHDKRHHKKNRSRLFYDHQWQSRQHKNLTITAAYRYVSDSHYLSDFENLLQEKNTLNLPRHLTANYHSDQLNAQIKLESFQKLIGTDQDGKPISDKDRPYARLPQIDLVYTLPTKKWQNFQDFDIIHHSNIAYFKKSIKDQSDSEKSGLRAFNQLSLSRPWVQSWGYFKPKINLSHLYVFYDEASRHTQSLQKSEAIRQAFVPSVSMDMGLHFEKKGAAFGFDKALGGYQLLSPRLKYLYAPHKDQSQIPIFNTSLGSISYDQLLADGWLLGYDRLADLNAITPAIHYRYIDRQGNTRLDFALANQYYLSRPKVDLGNAHIFASPTSGLAWQASIQPKANLWLDTQGSLKPNNDINALAVLARYQPNHATLLSAGIINRQNNANLGQKKLFAYTATAILPINALIPTQHNWQIIAHAQYDSQNRHFMEALTGLNYEDCCIGVSIYGRQYRNDLHPEQKPNRAIMAEIRLGKQAGSGRLNHLLGEKVIGFDGVRSTWQGK